MPNPVIARLYRQQGAQGWTSNYFLNSTDLQIGLGDAQAINTLEMAMLGQSTECHRISVSQLGVKRDVNAGPAVTSAGKYVGAPGTSIDGNLCLTIQLAADPITRAPKFLRGLPQSICDAGPNQAQLTVTAVWKTAYDAWVAGMKGKVVLVRGPRTGPGPFTGVPFQFAPVIAADEILTLSIRRAGRPFGAPRGRRPVGA